MAKQTPFLSAERAKRGNGCSCGDCLARQPCPACQKSLGGDLRWRCARATRAIVERAILRALVPLVIPGSRQPQHAQGHGKRNSLRGVRDGVQDGALGSAVGHALGVESETGMAYEEEGQADDGQEKPDPALEHEDFCLEFELVHSQNLGGHHGALSTANPTGGRGARHTEVMDQLGVTFFADDVSKSVVIRLTAGRGWHASRLIAPVSQGKTAKEQFPLRFHACCICDAITPGCAARSWADALPG